MGCPQLPLHDQLPSPKERHVSEPDEIPFSTSQSNSSVDNYNRQSQKSFNNDQCLLEEVEPGKNYRHCIWCINFSSYQEQKERISFNPKKKRPTPFSSETKWRSDSKDRKV